MSLHRKEPPFKPGDKFQKFEFRRLLGAGGQGFVYEGYDAFLDHVVAIKVIPTSTERASDIRQRAQMEARILFRLHHPNVVQFFGAEVTERGMVFIVMEMLQGRSLRAALTELKQLQVDEALLIGTQIAEGMQAAHENNAIHRDLKPENVFVEPGNVAKILDFGIAKITGMGAVTTQQNVIQGTLQYMSPEHLQGNPVTAQSDIFALGCILYELVSGCAPALMGMEASTQNLIGWNQMSRVPPRLDKVSDRVPSAVGQAIHRMIAKEPANRPTSMAQVASELKALQARVTAMFNDPPRELWRCNQATVRVPTSHVDSFVSTTAPDASCADLAESDEPISQRPMRAETMPLPLIRRSNPPEPQAHLANKARRASAPSRVANEPVTITAKSWLVTPLVRKRQLVMATFLGVVVGTIVMIVSQSSDNKQQNDLNSSILATTAIAASEQPPAATGIVAHMVPSAPPVATSAPSPVLTETRANLTPSTATPAASARHSNPTTGGSSSASGIRAITAPPRKQVSPKPATQRPEPPFKLDDMTF